MSCFLCLFCFAVLYKNNELRLVWEHFEAVDNETPLFRIRYWWTAECTNWENPIPVLLVGVLKFVNPFSSFPGQLLHHRRPQACP